MGLATPLHPVPGNTPLGLVAELQLLRTEDPPGDVGSGEPGRTSSYVAASRAARAEIHPGKAWLRGDAAA